MKKKYLISQVATYFSVPKDTLRYYDKINLLSPKKDKENGYRYYQIEDIIVLSYIMSLKDLGLSLDQIKNIVYKSNLEELRNEMIKQERVIEDKIKELQLVKKRIGIFREGAVRAQGDRSFSIKRNPYFLYKVEYLEVGEGCFTGALYTLEKDENIINPYFTIVIMKEYLKKDILEGEGCLVGASGESKKGYVKEGFMIFSHDKCLYKIVEVKGDCWEEVINEFKDEVMKKNYKIVGDAICRAVAFENNSNIPKDFYEIFLPIA